MKKAHEYQLQLILEEVHSKGVAVILQDDFKRWHNAERVSVGMWRELADTWEDTVGEDEKKTLLVGEANGFWALAWGEGLGTTKDSWFKDVRFLAKRVNASGVNSVEI